MSAPLPGEPLDAPPPPRILPRAEHNVSRKNIDPDALKVLYRLKNHGFIAYLVGGGVRDLLLDRKPKDFDIGTSALPQQVRRLFRNAFTIGRRFRLCHVRFGKKVVEVSTFRQQAEPEEGDTLIRSDNVFGTPEEDAFRRDFTVNALFYDIATFSVIDYVGGLEDLEHRVIRTIGDPAVRLREDPVRMLRAAALASRLGFRIDRDTVEAIRFLRGEIVKSSPARLLDEIYKILRQGAARPTFEQLHELGLLAYLFPEADRALARGPGALLSSLDRLDACRAAGANIDFSNSILLGSLLVPLGMPLRVMVARRKKAREGEEVEAEPPTNDVAAEMKELGATEAAVDLVPIEAPPVALPFARRDIDRLRLILAAQPRLADVSRPAAGRLVFARKPYFDDALRWLEVHGGVRGQELAAHWRSLDVGDIPPPAPREMEGAPHEPRPGEHRPSRRRSRRRRRRPRGAPAPRPE